jgi:hypothetical protein
MNNPFAAQQCCCSCCHNTAIVLLLLLLPPLLQVRQLRANERLPFRNQSNNGRFGIPTFEEYIDVALQAGRPVGIYPGE